MLPALSLVGPILDGISSFATSSPSGTEAVTKSARITNGGTLTKSVTEPETDFGAVLSQIANQTVDSLKTAEAASISGIQGKASVQQVVESVMDAQQSLQTAMAVRDKIVSAYQSISQMAI